MLGACLRDSAYWIIVTPLKSWNELTYVKGNLYDIYLKTLRQPTYRIILQAMKNPWSKEKDFSIISKFFTLAIQYFHKLLLSRYKLRINDTKCYSISRHKPLKPVDNFGDWLLATTKNWRSNPCKKFSHFILCTSLRSTRISTTKKTIATYDKNWC